MYPEIQKELDNGSVILEWDYSKGEPPAPLLKEKYSNERKKAKIMNFSIAYGKTVHGFSKDWGCTIEEAQNTVDLWYNDRPEVSAWQKVVQNEAISKGWTKTLLGRYRNLTKHFKDALKMNGGNRNGIAHGLRAAINTPIQGGAADVVIAAMVRLHRDDKLRELGFKLLLQVHDEVILEGPEEHS
jgi:DNA polymerase-1